MPEPTELPAAAVTATGRAATDVPAAATIPAAALRSRPRLLRGRPTERSSLMLGLHCSEDLVGRKRHGAQTDADCIEYRVGDRRRHNGRGRLANAPRSFMRAIDEFHLDLRRIRKG